MTNRADFDPAEAIQGVRKQQAEEEAKKRAGEEAEEQRRANVLKLLRYAEEQLEEISNPVVSEFVVTERWWTTEQISDKRAEKDFKKTLRAN